MAPWLNEEASRLIELVLKYRLKSNKIVDWAAVMERMPGRTKQQCQTYINNYQRREKAPKYNLQRRNYKWTKTDEAMLLRVAAELYNNWELIYQRYFPNLSARRLKNKHCQLVKQRANEKRSQLDEIAQLLAFY